MVRAEKVDREDKASATRLIGAVLEGAYQITRLIAEGGMGAVYEGIQLRLNKRVAVKVMARALAANDEALVRFHREAEVTSHLGHPHLVTVIDFGTSEAGEPYLVMEYLNGEDLDHRLRREGRLPMQTAVEITKQVASALAAAHAQGIVHRDLKPGNVFLVQLPGEADFVKVLDFGVSKIKAARTKLTRSTSVIGTPDYMAPEQATGMIDDIDHHVDQWALACIAWEMLGGRPPFVADDLGALLYQIINLDPQPLLKRVPDLPKAAEEVLRRALAKRLEARYPSIKDFAHAFEAAALGHSLDVTPAPAPQGPASKGTMGYGEAAGGERSIETAATRVMASKQPTGDADPLAEHKRTTFRTTTGELAVRLLHSRFKLAYAIPFAVGIVLAAALLLFRSQNPKTAASAPPRPVPAVRAPAVEPLPALPPVAAPAPVPAPSAEPTVAPAPPPTGHASRSKTAKPATETNLFMTEPNPLANERKANPFAGPFESEDEEAKAGQPSPATTDERFGSEPKSAAEKRRGKPSTAAPEGAREPAKTRGSLPNRKPAKPRTEDELFQDL